MSEDIDRQILRKYDIESKLGKGVRLQSENHHALFLCYHISPDQPALVATQAYGIVWKATDKKTHQTIALKKIFDAFQNSTDAQVSCHSSQACHVTPGLAQMLIWSSIYLQRTFREIMFLQELDNHENIIK